jgi:hypothetical protein
VPAPHGLTSTLRQLGANRYDLLLPETRSLGKILQPDEEPLAVLYGKYYKVENHIISRGLLVITNQRLLVINKKFLFLRYDSINFNAVSGFKFSSTGFFHTFTLNTKIATFVFRTYNRNCAEQCNRTLADRFDYQSYTNPKRK